ncbi:MAG: SpoIIE family protein phosphatase [Candidatus Izemoplasmatales bacterium]|nr:SpoIIE family protein phosphatase [Candidatus Izemoplasmatales bacterium]MDY0139561.1 SpoIIE family protein phosphatase [Candidatus Izemoplasmatales bacterium]
MNDLFLDFGYKSLTKYNETLCGDHIEHIHNENSEIFVLADGLGSGVKASILATLTSKIISTMMAHGMEITDCIETVAKTLPTCKTRDLAYSTFTMIRFVENDEVEIIQYDNPSVILIRNNEYYDFYKTEMLFEERRVFHSRIKIQVNDLFVAFSDGCLYAGVGNEFNFGWQKENIINFVKEYNKFGYNAKTLVKLLLDKCDELYGYKPGDDCSSLIVKVIERQQVNLLIGPPKNKFDNDRMMSLFFAKNGKKIICGGTTSQLAANYLNQELRVSLDYDFPSIPPVASIEGVDLVTEGVITINQVLNYTKDFLDDNKYYVVWTKSKDAASKITRILIDEATDINFYVGKAINPAHQNVDLPISFSIKMQLVEELAGCLRKIGKTVKVSYF